MKLANQSRSMVYLVGERGPLLLYAYVYFDGYIKSMGYCASKKKSMGYIIHDTYAYVCVLKSPIYIVTDLLIIEGIMTW